MPIKTAKGKTIEIFKKDLQKLGHIFFKELLEVIEWRKAVNSIGHFIRSMVQIYKLEHECNNKKKHIRAQALRCGA